MKKRNVAIIGIGQTNFCSKRDDASIYDIVKEATDIALRDAGITREEIEAIVFPLAPDSLAGVLNSERWCVDSTSARNKRLIRINTGGSTGLSAVQVAYYHIASGMNNIVLVAGADKVGESGDVQIIMNKIWDPIYERKLPLTTINMLALSAIRYMHKYGMTETDMAKVVVKARNHASRNPHAHLRKKVTIDEVLKSRILSWPIKLFDSCPSSSGGAAMILASEDVAKKICIRPAWIRGIGQSTETYYLGDRMGTNALNDHADAYALSESFKRAYKMAGIVNPVKEVDVAELYNPFSNTEYHAIDAAGLCERGESIKLLGDGYFDIDGEVAVNPSGGTLCTNPIAVTGLIRAGEAALQVMHKAGDRQVKGAKVAIASANGGDHQFFATAVIGQDY
ncbi:MAG: thiolase family protein [Pseudomonadota bacterium]